MVWYYRYLIYFGIFLSVITGYNIWANHEQSIGYDKAKVEYEKVIQDQKDIATQALITETAKVTVKEKELQEFKNNREVIDRANTKKVNALSNSVRAMSQQLRDPHQISAIKYSNSSSSSDSSNSNSGSGNGAEASGLLSAELTGLLSRITSEADEINLAYISCKEDSQNIRKK